MKKLVVGTLLLLMALAMDTACAEETPCFGPRQYMRTQGKPDFFTERIASCSGTATVKVINGEPDGTRRISSAEIKVNGVPIFSPRDFNQNIHVITTQILLEADNTLTVALRSGGGKAQGGDLFRFPIVHSTLRGRIWHYYLDNFLKWCGFGKPGSKPKPEAPYLTIAIFGPSEPTWPPPTATLAASPMSITAGHPVTLAWTTTDAETCAIEPGLGSVAANGILELFPHETTTYTLVATGPGGTISADATVTVESPPPLLNVRIAKPAEGDVIPGRTITVTGTVSVSDVAVAVNGIPALVMDGIFIAENIALEFGDNTLIVTAVKGDDHAEHRISVHVPGIDLVPVDFDLVAYNLDHRSLKLDGTAHIVIANQGTGDLTGAFFLVLFEDTDGDGHFDYETDNLLAEAEVSEGLQAGDVMEMLVDFRGQSHFRDNPLHLFLDSHNAVEETDKNNNLASVERIGVDVSASYPRVDNASCPDAAVLTVRIGNAGQFELAPGLPVSFYDGDPREGGMRIGTAWSTTSLLPGGFEDVSLTWPDADSLGPVFAMADDDGTGNGFYSESDTDNNLTSAAVAVCSGPQATPDSISGLAKDALTGLPLQGAVIALQREVDGAPGSLVHQLETPADGGFLFADLPPGAYYLSASLDGYIDARRRVMVDADHDVAHRHLVLSPLPASDQIRIVLTWGEHPRDLDAHLTGPNPHGCRHRCNYWNRQIPGAQLDRDDTLGFGPETITLTKGTEGTFRYYVHDFTNRNIKGSALAASEARVVVHFGTGADSLVFEVPPQAGTVWHVFEIDGLSGQLTAVNRMAFQSESGKIDFPVFTSTPPTSVTWGTPYVYEVTAEDPDNDPLTFSLLESPSGMHLDPYTGILQWDPDTWQGGSHKVTLQVLDGRCGQHTHVKPTVHIQAAPQVLAPGQGTTLTWLFTDADTCHLSSNFGLSVDEVPLGGSLDVTPDRPTRYTLACTGPGGTVADSLTVSFVAPEVAISAEPVEVVRGQTTTLSWDSFFAETCAILPGIGAVAPNGSIVVSPSDSITYTITITGPGGTAADAVTVHCIEPDIQFGPAFQAIPLGEDATLTWNVPHAETIRIDPLGLMPAAGSITVSPTETTEYTIRIAGCGRTITTTATVQVLCPPSLTFIAPGPSDTFADTDFLLRWVVADCGNNAATALYYLADSGDTLIASGVQRNPDGTAQYLWDTAAVPEGTYHIFAMLDDGRHAPVTVHADHPVIIDHSAPPMPWITLAASDGGAYDAFSSSLALSEKHAVVGAPNHGEDRNGAVYLFEREGGTWTETAKLECPQDRDCRSFGSSLAIDGETLVVGASSGSWNDAEPSFIFSLHDGEWIQQGALFPEAGGRYNEFGRSVVVGGDTVLIGAPGWSEGASGGTVYPFNRQDGAWTEQPRLLPGSNNTALQFGYSLWLEGDSLIVGTSPYQVADSPIPPVAERVLFFQRAGDGWHVDATLMGMDSTGLEHGARFGTAVHLNGNTAIVGSPQAENYHGAAYLFERDVHSGEWTPTARLLAGDSAHGGKFGTSVWIDGDYAYVGTGYSDYHSQNPGDAVYIFRHQDGNWGEQHKIRPGNNLPKIGFGENIAVANGRLLVSAAQARQDDTPVGRAYLYTTCAADLAVSPSAIAPGATATLSWRTELADTITIEPDIGAVAPAGSIAVSPSATTTYIVTATGPLGTAAAGVTVAVTTGDHINVQITSPNAGDTIPKPYTMVEGMIANHQGLKTGVTVNGVPAVVYGDMFIVNHIALAPGENTLTAIATDTAGHTAAARVTVDRDPDQPYIRLEARPVTGASPLESTLTLSGSFMIDETVSHAITGWSLTHAAPGEVKIHNTAADQYSLHISGEGIYYFRAEVEDADQNRLTDTIAIVVLEEAGLDALLQGKWTGMKQALAERDIDGALNHFDPEMQGLYHDIYTALYDDLPAMAAAMQAIELVEIGENHARYRIRKEENYSGDRVTITYYIYFARDDQGIWRIYRY